MPKYSKIFLFEGESPLERNLVFASKAQDEYCQSLPNSALFRKLIIFSMQSTISYCMLLKVPQNTHNDPCDCLGLLKSRELSCQELEQPIQKIKPEQHQQQQQKGKVLNLWLQQNKQEAKPKKVINLPCSISPCWRASVWVR